MLKGRNFVVCALAWGCLGISAAWAIPVSPEKNTAAHSGQKSTQKNKDANSEAKPLAPPPNPLMQVIRGQRPEPKPAENQPPG
jgi:hypothetical protein